MDRKGELANPPLNCELVEGSLVGEDDELDATIAFVVVLRMQ